MKMNRRRTKYRFSVTCICCGYQCETTFYAGKVVSVENRDKRIQETIPDVVICTDCVTW